MIRLLSFLFVATIALSAQLCPAQNRFFGKVVEIVDGRSFVLEAPTGRVHCTLQYVEVPEPEQALHQTVIDHLGALTLGKNAEFQIVAMTSSKLTGRMTVDGIDISLQLLRDGA